MLVYRIVKNSKRADDISGMGAFQRGGRWNSKGVYMLYTSENSSLALLENLVYFDDEDVPEKLYIIFIEINTTDELLYTLPEKNYPVDWMIKNSPESKSIGDNLMRSEKFLVIKIRSKINPYDYNYLLNPLFPGYHDMVKIIAVEELPVDMRLISRK